MKTKPKKLAPVPAKLTWKKGRRDRLTCSDRMTWESHCGGYKIERLESRYGLGVVVLAVVMLLPRSSPAKAGEFLIYRGRSRKAAEKACLDMTRSGLREKFL